MGKSTLNDLWAAKPDRNRIHGARGGTCGKKSKRKVNGKSSKGCEPKIGGNSVEHSVLAAGIGKPIV